MRPDVCAGGAGAKRDTVPSNHNISKEYSTQHLLEVLDSHPNLVLLWHLDSPDTASFRSVIGGDHSRLFFEDPPTVSIPYNRRRDSSLPEGAPGCRALCHPSPSPLQVVPAPTPQSQTDIRRPV